MPEKFRAAGTGSTGGSRSTRRLLTILIVVLVVAGLGVVALLAFQGAFNQASNENTSVIVTNQTRNTTTTNSSNQNSNANLNANANVNASNSNQNANLNTNTTNTNTTNTNTTTSVTPLPSSTDTDADGLTDVEEVVYGTDSTKPDSDSDGFIDGKREQPDGTVLGELYLGYNPAGTGRLEESTIVKRVANSTNRYSILIPTSWTATLDQSGGVLVAPSQGTGESFQVRINSNPSSQTPIEWYRTVDPNVDTSSLKTDAFNGFEVLWNPDRSTAYLFKETDVYSILYSTGSLTQANYWTTFDMIVRSFKLVASS